MRTSFWCASLCVAAMCIPAYATYIELDNWDAQANTTDLTPIWIQPVPGFRVEDHQVRTQAPEALMTYNVPGGIDADDAISIEAIDSKTSATQYVALVLRYKDLAHNVYIKLQDNGGTGFFSKLFFYYGGNSDGWAGMTAGTPGGSSSAMVNIALTDNARIRAAVNGEQVTVQIDYDKDGVWDVTEVRGGLPVSTLGAQYGVGGYGNAKADNFGKYIGEFPTPEPSALALLAAGILVLKRKTA